MRRLYNIGILTALWGRHEVADIVLRYYSEMEIEGLRLHRVAVGSEGDVTHYLAESNNWHYTEAPNEPLSDKWNAGMAKMKGHVDAVLIVGSDDLLSEKTIRMLVAEWENGADVVGLEDLYYYDLPKDAVYYSRRSHPGAGMLIGASPLTRLSWQPWPSGLFKRLDGQLINRLTTDAYPCKTRYIDKCSDKEAVLVDIKTDTNMWSVEDMARMTGRVDRVPNEELDKTFPGLRELLKQTNHDHA